MESQDEIEKEFNDYFQNLFTSSRPSHNRIEEALTGLKPKVTPKMNAQLVDTFTAEDIENALSHMCPTNQVQMVSLLHFIKKHWLSVREGVIDTCLHILNNQGNLAPLNHIYIALIPKTEKPWKVYEFRPISLCNVIYKIIAKAIANRLKPILAEIIHPSQSAFIPNRLITDNVIIIYECLHKIRHSKGKRNGLVALKLDINKAYNKIEYGFLNQTMAKLSFSQNLIKLIMNCVSIVSFSTIINGVPKSVIVLERGIRQGYHMSPYLFIICAEAFSSLLV